MTRKTAVHFILALCLIQSFPLRADTPAGQAGAFLRMGLGARAIGMGNAMTGLARDGFAGFHNPASLPFMANPELAFSLGLLSLDRTHSFIGFSTYLQPKSKAGASGFRGGLALGWIHAGVANIDIRDGDGNHFGMLSNSENAFFASFALQPFSRVGVGITLKVVQNRFPGLANDASTVNAEGFGFDLGLYGTPIEKLSLGAVLKDLGTKYTWDTEKLWDRGSKTVDLFPKLLRLGAAYALPHNALASMDVEFNEEQGWRVYLGGEAVLREAFTIRTGLNDDRLAFGFGVRFKIWNLQGELDYAYDTISITPSSEQHVSWRLSF